MPWAPTVVLAIWVFRRAVLVGSLGASRLSLAPGSDDRRAGVCGALAGLPRRGESNLPVLEYTRQSSRAAGGGPHDIYPFSPRTAPIIRVGLAESLRLEFLGEQSLDAPDSPSESTCSCLGSVALYMGGFTLILAFGVFGFRNGPPWRGWLSAIALISLVASTGEFSSPLWWARQIPALD